VLGNPFRIKVLLAIGGGEACVCHLEAVLDQRQAFISQHLMALRKAKLLETRRDGKYIFYRLSDQAILELVRKAAALSGLPEAEYPEYAHGQPHPECCCPKCGEEE
jgi:ArsR family transcriptional regulator